MFVQTLKKTADITLRPNVFWKKVKPEHSLWPSVFVLFLCCIVFLPIMGVLALAEPDFTSEDFFAVSGLLMIYFIFFIGWMFLSAGVLHFCAKMLGSEQKYVQSLKITCYPLLLGFGLVTVGLLLTGLLLPLILINPQMFQVLLAILISLCAFATVLYLLYVTVKGMQALYNFELGRAIGCFALYWVLSFIVQIVLSSIAIFIGILFASVLFS